MCTEFCLWCQVKFVLQHSKQTRGEMTVAIMSHLACCQVPIDVIPAVRVAAAAGELESCSGAAP